MTDKPEKFDMSQVVGLYISLRDSKAKAEADLKETLKPITEKMNKLEAWIKAEADGQGVTSFKTKAGTAFVTTSDYASVADWDALVEWVKQQGAYDVLTKGVNKTAVRGYMENDKAVPPGVNYGTKVGLSVRRPSTGDK